MFVKDNIQVLPFSLFKSFTRNSSCYGGKHRRNLLTFPETLQISCLWSFFIISENITLILIQRFSTTLSPRTIFMVYYGFLSVLIQLYHGLWLPIKYLRISREEYYELWAETKDPCSHRPAIRPNSIEPRRYFYSTATGTTGATRRAENCTRFSYSRRGATTTINIGTSLEHSTLEIIQVDI